MNKSKLFWVLIAFLLLAVVLSGCDIGNSEENKGGQADSIDADVALYGTTWKADWNDGYLMLIFSSTSDTYTFRTSDMGNSLPGKGIYKVSGNKVTFYSSVTGTAIVDGNKMTFSSSLVYVKI